MLRESLTPSITMAKYTKLLKDVSTTVLGNISDIFATFDAINTNNAGVTLYNMFMNKYRYYEINDIDEDTFYQIVIDTFYEYFPYYKELAINYNKEYDYALGNKRSVTHNETTNTVSNTTDNNVSKNYDLPHKQVSESGTTTSGYMTDRRDNENTIAQTGVNQNAVETTYSYDNEFLDLKRKYLAQIRNLNSDYVNKFSDCFIHIFG